MSEKFTKEQLKTINLFQHMLKAINETYGCNIPMSFVEDNIKFDPNDVVWDFSGYVKGMSPTEADND